jgi:hypothetical protein
MFILKGARVHVHILLANSCAKIVQTRVNSSFD